jgi:Kef-type K+ transport system membrane component KefB/nucleotide-binding universal stress UspA family protein
MKSSIYNIMAFGINLELPLQNPVLIFALILFIILFVPILLNKIKIPQIIGLIIAGAIVGPNGFHLMQRDSSILLFGTVGLLYIMFLAGIEIDLGDFKKHREKSMIFGIYTFFVPMIMGTLSGVYLLGFALPTSILLASMFASHTLLSYPIVRRYGISRNIAVNITIGGTMITDTMALLVLAAIVGMYTGDLQSFFWLRLSSSVILFGAIVLFLFPVIARWFFKRYHENVLQYIFVLGMVFLAGFLAEAAGIEAIIGAFLAGLAMNRLIPQTSPLMNRIEFVGNALFIPFFLIGVGMLIDFQVLFTDLKTIKVAVVMSVVATLSKFIAAWITQKSFNFSKAERNMIFGLSNAQAAATLAVVLVGYNIIIGAGSGGESIRLLDESVLNGTILMILVTCTISSVVTQRSSQILAVEEESSNTGKKGIKERILIPVNSLDNVDELVHLGLTIKASNNRKWLYALNIIDDEKASDAADKQAKKILDRASEVATSTDNYIHELMRYDINPVTGIMNVIKEHKITDLILGLHVKKDISSTFLGDLAEGLLEKCTTTIMIYKSAQPLATIKRHIIVVPEKAEKEAGFALWLMRIWNIGRNTGAKMIFHASPHTLKFIEEVQKRFPIDLTIHEFSDWDDFLILFRSVEQDDNLSIVMSRSGKDSYHHQMDKIPGYMDKYFKDSNYMLIYPVQDGIGEDGIYTFNNSSVHYPIESFEDFTKGMSSLFRKR